MDKDALYQFVKLLDFRSKTNLKKSHVLEGYLESTFKLRVNTYLFLGIKMPTL